MKLRRLCNLSNEVCYFLFSIIEEKNMDLEKHDDVVQTSIFLLINLSSVFNFSSLRNGIDININFLLENDLIDRFHSKKLRRFLSSSRIFFFFFLSRDNLYELFRAIALLICSTRTKTIRKFDKGRKTRTTC